MPEVLQESLAAVKSRELQRARADRTRAWHDFYKALDYEDTVVTRRRMRAWEALDDYVRALERKPPFSGYEVITGGNPPVRGRL